jgi:hypothetical protein
MRCMSGISLIMVLRIVAEHGVVFDLPDVFQHNFLKLNIHLAVGGVFLGTQNLLGGAARHKRPVTRLTLMCCNMLFVIVR